MFTDLFVRCTSGGSQWPSDSDTMPEKCRNPDVHGMKKKTFSWSLFQPLSPESTLCLFSQICQCHLGLWVIFYPQCLTDNWVLALWESKSSAEINPVPLRCSVGQGNRRSPPLLCKNRSLYGECWVSTWEIVIACVSCTDTDTHSCTYYTHAHN